MKEMGIKELFRCYVALTHANIAAYDSQFRCIYNMIDSIRYCHTLHHSSKCLTCCINSDDLAFKQVKETGKSYFYTCPFGLEEGILPVKSGGDTVGYLFVGPVVDLDRVPDDEELLTLAQQFFSGAEVDALRVAALELAHCDGDGMEIFRNTTEVFLRYIEQNCLPFFEAESITQSICRYVCDHLDKKITLLKLSKELHCCTVTLTEHFRRDMGMSIMQYVLCERMALAKRLLSHPSLPIAEVALRCGFQDAEYFSKCFKQQHHCSPTEWRRARSENAADESSAL